ncbi:hypothetical protein ABKV19_011859 [Rosa sericea]
MAGIRSGVVSVLFVLFACFFSIQQLSASDDTVFYDSFDESFEGRWTVSGKDEYQGVWKHSKSEGHEDFGLLVSEKAKKYAIVKEVDEPVSLKDGTVVLQFETRLQNGLECGGAYLKYLRPQEAGWEPKIFDNESPYSVMFGPDKCGLTNKVHFIFKHKNPKSGEYVEHHLTTPPSVPTDKLSHVYTAIIKPDNELIILVDGEEKKKANFLSTEDFMPPLIPTKTIPDPEDKKPEDWDERAKIPDPNAVKPDDWDEDAPMEIEDEEAEKPEGWLDDEPEEIPNPSYFELEKPNFEPIAAIGIEIWTMQDGILFDNILITKDEKVAHSYRETQWKPKFEVEKEKEKAEEDVPSSEGLLANVQKKTFELLYKVADVPFLAAYKSKIIDLIEKAEEQPNITLGVIGSIAVIILTALFMFLFGGKKPAKVEEKPTVATEASGSGVEKKEEESEKEGSSGENEKETGAAPRRRTGPRREN